MTAHQLAEYDVVIVGSGFAGLAAGIGSLRAGARSVIVEKRGHLGGNSRISEAILAAAGTDEQARMGIYDTAELLVNELSDWKVKADALLERSRLGTGPIRRRWRQRSRSAPSVVGARDHAQGHRPPTASAPVCADTEERR
ncbi:MAG: FAD-binding protein [Actinomycetia bacterium]|nr:FAD-binding protein [Actinomycetes bacterium]